MTVDFLQSGDILSLAELEKNCFPDAWDSQSWQEEFARPNFFAIGAKEHGVLVGYVCGVSLFEESELLKIAVAPSFRGQGFGEKLINVFFQAAKTRGAEKMFLEVRESNVPAIKLYEKHAFTPLRIRKNYYADGENAVEMVKLLDKE